MIELNNEFLKKIKNEIERYECSCEITSIWFTHKDETEVKEANKQAVEESEILESFEYVDQFTEFVYPTPEDDFRGTITRKVKGSDYFLNLGFWGKKGGWTRFKQFVEKETVKKQEKERSNEVEF